MFFLEINKFLIYLKRIYHNINDDKGYFKNAKKE